MKSIKVIIVLILLFAVKESVSQSPNFTGHSGVYFLGTADLPIAENIYSKSNISGVVIRTRWESLETEPGVFNWDFIDGELLKAGAANKKCSIALLGTPAWLSQLNAALYFYIDKNIYHSTYGDTLSAIISWDNAYVARLKLLIQQLAAKYRNDDRISYWNLVSGQMSRNLPDSVVTSEGTQPFPSWSGYQPDTLVKKMKEVLDVYMQSFPNTPLWASMDYQRFEPAATGKPKNYVAQQFSDYGITNYPDRFGVWREDLSGCNPNLSTLQSVSQWYILKENPCRNGAQMVWSVQDGPTRMNQCGIIPNTETFVLDSAVQHGITLGMRYLEIYGIDINDPALDEIITKANNLLISKGSFCNNDGTLSELISEETCKVYPNPSVGIFTLEARYSGHNRRIEVFNAVGQKVFESTVAAKLQTINLSKHPPGIYFLKIYSNEKFQILNLLMR